MGGPKTSALASDFSVQPKNWVAGWKFAFAMLVTAEMVARPNPCVVTGKVALVAPWGTVTVAGTVAMLVALLLRLTTVPPAGAAAEMVTVHVTDEPMLEPAAAAGVSALTCIPDTVKGRVVAASMPLAETWTWYVPAGTFAGRVIWNEPAVEGRGDI